MMKLLSFKSTLDLLLLFVCLSVLRNATTGSETVSATPQSTNISTKPPPQNVDKVDVVTQNKTSITLRWNKVYNFSTYILKYDREKEVNVEADYVVSSLTAGTNYSFTLFTVSGERRSAGYSFFAETAPENVDKVKVVTQNKTSITLSWTKVKDISTYSLGYDGTSTNVTTDHEDRSVQYVVSPLTAGTEYNFTLFTVFGGVRSSGRSVSAVTAPENVGEVEVKDQNETSIILRLDKVKDISTYILEYDGKKMDVNAEPEQKSVQYVVSPLSSGTNYSFILYTVSGELNSTGYSFFAVTAPENVNEVVVKDQNETSITLRWDKVKDISTYILGYDGTSTNVTADHEDRSVQYVVSPLTAGTEYNFTVFTVFGGVHSSGRSVSAVTAPENVNEVVVKDQNETSITLSWTKVKDISTYILEYDGTSTNVTADHEDRSVQYVVSPLTAGTEYNFTVFTVFGGVHSSGRSVSAVTAPENVNEVVVKDQNETSITLSWTKVKDISTYILEYDGTSTNVTADHEDRSVQYVVSPLTAGTKYNFTVFTVFGGVRSSGRSVSAVTAPENVEKVEVKDQNETSITLSWTKVKDISTYILGYDGTSTNVTADHEDRSVQYVVSPLTAGTKYSFTLFTVFGGVHSSGRSVSAVTAPENVDKVEVKDQNETSITLSWVKVKDISTYILGYDGTSTNVNADHEDRLVQYVVSPLTAGTKYNFTVFTVFERVNSTGRSFSAVTVPTKVSSVNVTERSATYLTLQWESLNDAWEYEIAINASGASNTSIKSSNIMSYLASNLHPGTLYAFSVITQFSGVSSNAYESITVTTIDCASVNWFVTNSSIQGTVEGLFSNATATNKSHVYVSPGGATVSFTGLYPGATYVISLEYEISSTSLPQCQHILTILPPLLTAHCEFWGSGYSARIVWDKPNGVWTSVELNVTGKNLFVSGQADHLIIDGLQPAKKYKVSLASVSGTERKSEPFVFSCLTDQRGVIAGSFFAVLLFGLLACVVVFIFLKRPDIIRRKKPFIGGSKIPSAKEKAISAANFPDHFSQLSADENRGFSQEYEELASVGTDQTHKVAILPDNKAKNRFTNVLPYDWCRVKLNTSSPSEILDYINASYMPGYNCKREYIATQGPLPSTVNDFWRMIWEQRAKGIVMVTNCTEAGRTKCEQYWPEDRNPCSYAELLVTVRSEQQEPSWTLREFGLKNRNTSEERTVKHFHFTAWPDHGVPQDTQVLIQFRGLVRRHIESNGTKAPTVVHCSAGVGRTGTIIALDVLLQQLENEQAVGINGFVHRMRLNRPHMVQTESQYVFLHQCIMDSLQPSMKTDEHIYENTDLIYVNATALRELR
ncbi:receptor-type tyrosine-protein phosphatase H-like [Melanotaenia boesemani]|uniref:receptor-type tyrosine-protein phosphatase H-like n=1 Tax=Melanotaenia boesemani TaxID=1250792 RepID=UPI001C03A681|nr:receptor-type tyrosine-protein phosphatase H-like [Melanotaenia boesemani]